MPDPRRTEPGRRGTSIGWLVLVSTVALAVATPVAVLAGSTRLRPADAAGLQAPRPGESCPDATPAPGSSDVCDDVTPTGVPGGGLDLAGLLPIVAGVLLGGVIALGAVFVILARRPSGPLAAADPAEWWTCRSCGKTNVVGSPRCYDCGTWQG